MGGTAIILSGGGLGPRPETLPTADFVVAADSGIHLADRLGLEVHLVVGDMDSADPDLVRRAVSSGAEVRAHPADKDATDLELALEEATARGATRLVVAGGGGGRLDHLLGVALLLASPRWAEREIEWHTDQAVAYPIHSARVIACSQGDLISVLPTTPTAMVTIGGTRWELTDTTLEFGTSRGISNEAIGEQVRIAVTSGAVLAVHSR